jgi:hypothetical protein
VMEMANYTIIESEPHHFRMLVERLRDEDKAEIEAAGLSANKALWKSYRSAMLRRTAFVDGEIAAMWGVSGTLMSNVGHPWLLTTPACEKVPFAYVREGKKHASEMLQLHPILSNFVDASYERAIRFLKLAGFDVGKPFPFGKKQMPFCKFEMRAH